MHSTDANGLFQAIPQELKERNQWTLWKPVKGRKLFFHPNGRNAKSNDPSAFTSFDEVVKTFTGGGFTGIAYMLQKTCPFFGIDIDDCILNGKVVELDYLIENLKSTYVEISPSGTGVHAIGIASAPEAMHCGWRERVEGGCAIELYTQQAFCMTGMRYEGSSPTCTDIQGKVGSIAAMYFAKKTRKFEKTENSEKEIDDAKFAETTVRNYLKTKPDSISFSGGSDAMFSAACVTYDFGLTDELAHQELSRFNDDQTDGEPWSDTEMAHKLVDAKSRVLREGKFGAMKQSKIWYKRHPDAADWLDVVDEDSESPTDLFQNYEMVEKTAVGLPMKPLIHRALDLMAGKMVSAGGSVYFDHGDGKITPVKNQSDFFGRINARLSSPAIWKETSGCITKAELWSETRNRLPQYRAIESCPHFPELEDHYYACETVALGNGEHFEQFLNFFCPATSEDRDLIRAAAMTMFWGCVNAPRPMFVVTGEGRGTGKSKLVQMLSRLCGGFVSVTAGGRFEDVKTRLLSDGALTKRVCLMDNVKGGTLSWAELEDMLTSPDISGRKNYVGECSRPNNLTWFLTANGASLSTDLAQRSYYIKLVKPKCFSSTWENQVYEFISKHERSIFADIAARFAEAPAPMPKHGRLASWEKAVLSRASSDPGVVFDVSEQRRSDVDYESDQKEFFLDFLDAEMLRKGWKPNNHKVFIPSKLMNAFWRHHHSNADSINTTTRTINGWDDAKNSRHLRVSKSRKIGRGFIWGRGTLLPNTTLTGDASMHFPDLSTPVVDISN